MTNEAKSMTLRHVSPGTLAPKMDTERLSSAAKARDPKALRRACEEFEAVFTTYLLKSMRKTIPRTESADGGLAKDIYTAMMDEEVARAAAKGPGIGLAAALYQQLSQSKNT